MTVPTTGPLRIGLAQMSPGDDPEANVRGALACIAEAAGRGAGIVCLPELFRSRYFCQKESPALFDLAEPIDGATIRALSEACRKWSVVVVASIFERRAPGLHHNTAVVIEADGTVAGIYRKMHIPHDPLYYEKYYFAPGDTGFRAFETTRGRIGPLVCWDQWYPEAARIAALRGAEILLYPTAIGWHPAEKAEWGAAQLDAWITIQRSHAIANGVFVAAVNRVGLEGSLQFWGTSFVCDPFGRILARAGSEGEEVLVVDCDLRLVEEVRRNWPFLRDRRTDAYGGIASRYLDDAP